MTKLAQPFIFSQSTLQDYCDCPQRFLLRYIERIVWPAIETEPALEYEQHQQEGLLFHRMAQQYLIGIPVDQIARFANTANLSHWWDNFVNKTNLAEQIHAYNLFPEMTLSAALGKHRLTAKYDLIAIQTGKKALIYDWKTYTKRPHREWLNDRMQTCVYRCLLVEAGRHLNDGRILEAEQIEMVYWLANFPDEPIHLQYNASQYQRDRDALNQLMNEIAASEAFPLTEDVKKCRFCNYRSYCNRGIEAGSWQELEAEEEPGAADFEINLEQITEIAF